MGMGGLEAQFLFEFAGGLLDAAVVVVQVMDVAVVANPIHH